MRGLVVCALLTPMLCIPAVAAPAPKPLSAAQAKKLLAERDELKARLAAAADLQQQLAAVQQSRELARQDAEAAKKALADMKASLSENQSSGDAILQELRKAKEDAEAARAESTALKARLEVCETKLNGQTAEGALVMLSREITPARPMNLSRVTPSPKKVDRGIVVVNVLVSEGGDVLDARLLQGLPGEDEWVRKANDECMEAAKHLVFDPARASDGKTRVRVWQGVGFYLK